MVSFPDGNASSVRQNIADGSSPVGAAETPRASHDQSAEKAIKTEALAKKPTVVISETVVSAPAVSAAVPASASASSVSNGKASADNLKPMKDKSVSPDAKDAKESETKQSDREDDSDYDSSEAETVILESSRRERSSKNGSQKRNHGRIEDSSDDDEIFEDDEPRKLGLAKHKLGKHKMAKLTHPGFRRVSDNSSGRSTSPADRPLQSSRKGRLARDASGRLLLQKLCDRGDFARSEELIRSGVDVNDRDYAGNTALHDAALKGHLDIVRLLLDNGAIIDIRSGAADLDTPLIDAASRGHLEVVKFLLDRGADPRILNAQGKSALDFVIDEEEEDQDYEKIALLLKESVRKRRRRRDSDGGEEDTLHALSYDPELSEKGTFPVSEQHGGAYRKGNGTNSTPTSGSADDSDNSNLPRRRGGARSHSIRNDLLWMDLTTKTGREQVYKKAADGDIQYVGRFLEEGWQPDGDCLVLAAKHGHTEIVGLLLAFGVKSDSLNEDGNTAIHETIGRGHIETIKLLLDSGSDPGWKDKHGLTYSDIARKLLGNDDDETILVENAYRKQKGLPLREKKRESSSHRTLKSHEETGESIDSGVARLSKSAVFSEDDSSKRNTDNERRESGEFTERNKEGEGSISKQNNERDTSSDANRGRSKVRRESSEIAADPQREEGRKKDELAKKEEDRLRRKKKEEDRRKREIEQTRKEEERKKREIEHARKEEERKKRALEQLAREEEERKTQKQAEEERKRQLEQEREELAAKEEERRLKLKEVAKQREIFEANKERERKEREKRMLKNLEEAEKQRAEQKIIEQQESEKRLKELEEASTMQRLAEAEQEAERQQKLKKKRELEQRKQYPYGIRTATLKKNRGIDSIAPLLPILIRTIGGTDYVLDVQLFLILELGNIYETYPDLSKKLVTNEEKEMAWNVLSPWMCKQLIPFDETVLTPNVLREREAEKLKFIMMPIFWLKMDEVKEVLQNDFPQIYEILPYNVAYLDSRESEDSNDEPSESAPASTSAKKAEVNLPVKFQLKLNVYQGL